MKKYLRIFITMIGIIVASLIIFGVVYKFEMRKDFISNSIFIVSIVVLCISVIMQTGATRVFLGLNYTAKSWISPKKTKSEYENFAEYYNEKAKDRRKDVLDIIVISLIFILISVLLANV